jgi:pimeloyl-ACP methyl ester carboxylesterase
LSDLGLDSLTSIDVGVQLEGLLPHRRDHLTIDPECTLASLLQILRPSQSPPITSSTKESHAVNDDLEEKEIRSPSVSPSMSITPNGVPTVLAPATALIANLSQEMTQAISSNPEVIRYVPGCTPLMLIHDGGGTAFAYYSLGNLDRTIIGVHCPGLQEGKGIVSVQHAANEYAAIARQYLEQSCPGHSKLVVGGWSLGGTISLIMAALFPDLVAGVVTIDTTPPGVEALTVEQAESVLLHPWSRTDGIHGLVRKQLQLNTRSLFSNPEYKTTLRVSAVNVPVYVICAMDPFLPPKSLQLPDSCSQYLLNFKQPRVAEVTWKALLGERLLGVQSIPGNHWTMFTPANAQTTTEALRQGLDAIEGWLNNVG